MHHVVVGAGEVGTAVAAVLERAHQVTLRDIEPVTAKADVLDICIPWSERFVEYVHDYVKHHEPSLVVVHSTVPTGTCDEHGWVHSPIRGRHPYLEEGVATFVKHFGGVRAAEAAKSWVLAGVTTAEHDRARDTEAGKLWELAQYGVQIQVEKAIHEWCEAHDVDFDVAYTAMAHSYNEGFQALGESRFTRPVLEHVPGPIGGHCVLQNSHLIDHELTRVVREGF